MPYHFQSFYLITLTYLPLFRFNNTHQIYSTTNSLPLLSHISAPCGYLLPFSQFLRFHPLFIYGLGFPPWRCVKTELVVINAYPREMSGSHFSGNTPTAWANRDTWLPWFTRQKMTSVECFSSSHSSILSCPIDHHHHRITKITFVIIFIAIMITISQPL